MDVQNIEDVVKTEESGNQIAELEATIENLRKELQILHQNEVVLKDTIIRLSMKMVGVI